MTKLFAVDSPESLREIAAFVKQGSVYNVATVWSATRRQQNDTCVWMGKSWFPSTRARRAVAPWCFALRHRRKSTNLPD